jgi:SAM-dependent MidA family methyltransferase
MMDAEVGSNPELVARIRAEIASNGPMTFARFMELALYEPELGYYSVAEARPTRSGDFLTAPELHPIFGRAIAGQVAEVWRRLDRPSDFTVREFGAGSGALAEALLTELRDTEADLAEVVRYAPIEHNRHRLAEARARLETSGFGDRVVAAEGPMTGVVLANEFLDALPVHRVEGGAEGRLLERYVVAGTDRLVERPGEPSTPELEARLRADDVTLAPGQRAEVRLADAAWVAGVGRTLERGAAFIIDYALPAAELYAPTRPDGTLIAYRGQRTSGDPFAAIGRQDLTAHVDVTALRRAAEAASLDVLGETSQAAFLVGNGLEALLEAARSDPRTTLAAWAELRSSIVRLLDPRALGGFRVLAFGRGIDARPPLAGFASAGGS